MEGGRGAGQAVVAFLALGGLRALALLPMGARLAVAGWLGARLVGPLTGVRRRAAGQIAEICPELPPDEVARIARGACGNALRGIIETHAGRALLRHVAGTPVNGPGLEQLRAAQAEGQGALILTGHFGSPHGARAAMCLSGTDVTVLYRPTPNGRINDAYHRALEEVSRPVFPRGRRGLADMVRYLRGGGVIAILADQVPEQQGAWLRFFGRPALTSLAPAELAVKYGVPMLPGFATRQPDGSIVVEVEAEIPHGPADAMMQAYNDRLEARIRSNMDQWLWMYPRWRAARAGGPGST